MNEDLQISLGIAAVLFSVLAGIALIIFAAK